MPIRIGTEERAKSRSGEAGPCSDRWSKRAFRPWSSRPPHKPNPLIITRSPLAKGSWLRAEGFATSGVDAPVREIAERAGVGLGTVYRHFPQRSDLIVAVMQSHVEACADAAAVFADEYEPEEALAHWLHRLMDFAGAKRGLAAALHSGDPAYAALPGYVMARLGGALRKLLNGAIAAKSVRSDIDEEELLWTVATMCRGPYGEKPAYASKMVDGQTAFLIETPAAYRGLASV
ncbi:MAG: TetR/AcrR family transcriptional regulator [Edaphobacter sp.]